MTITQLPTALPKTGTGLTADTPFGPAPFVAALCVIAAAALTCLLAKAKVKM